MPARSSRWRLAATPGDQWHDPPRGCRVGARRSPVGQVCGYSPPSRQARAPAVCRRLACRRWPLAGIISTMPRPPRSARCLPVTAAPRRFRCSTRRPAHSRRGHRRNVSLQRGRGTTAGSRRSGTRMGTAGAQQVRGQSDAARDFAGYEAPQTGAGHASGQSWRTPLADRQHRRFVPAASGRAG